MKRILPEEKMSWQRPILSISNEGAATKGNRYIVGETPTGIFSGLTTDNIAWYDGIQWQEDIPEEGWVLYDANQTELLIYMNGPSGDYWYYFKDIFGTGTGAGLVGTKEVDETNIADTKILEYDSTSDKLIYVAKPTGGGTGFFNKLDATTNPTVNDDAVDGYEVGSLWFNISTSKVFQCLNATTGAAVWVELTGGGSGVSVTNFTTYQNLLDDTTVGDGNFGTVTNLLNSIFIKFTDWYALGRKIIWKVTANTKWYLPFEDNVNDLSGNGYNATATDITYVTGKVGAKAANFNGTTSKAIYLGNPIGTSITNITMMCWVYLSSTSQKGICLDLGSNPDASGYNIKGFALAIGTTTADTAGNNLIGIYNGVRWIATGKALGTGWHHIAMTINGSSKPTMYADGVQVFTDNGTNPAALTTTNPNMVVGSSYNGRFFTGYIDEAIIESRLWTSQEIFEYFMQTQ